MKRAARVRFVFEGCAYRVSIPDLAYLLVHGENVVIVLRVKIDAFNRQIVIMIFDEVRFIRTNVE